MSTMLYTAFNAAVMEFLDDLSASFPACRPIASVREVFEMGVKVNKRMPVRLLHERMMVPFGDKIRRHDEDFFMNRDYSKEIDSGWAAGADMVGVLKGLWSTMSETDRECVFRHLDVIVGLYDAISESDALTPDP
jgi:hypothetical protein